LESVIPLPQENPTGVFFDQPTPESLIQAIDLFERNIDQFDSSLIRRNALPFHKNNFKDKIHSFIDQKYQEFRSH
jgi:hypothetical protein